MGLWLFSTLKKPAFAKLYLIPLVSNITMSMTGAIGVLYALDLGADVLLVNLITSIQSTMTILLEVPFGILSDRIGRKWMLVTPRILSLMGTMVRAFATEPTHLLLAAFVGGFAGGGFFPILLSMLGDIAKPAEQREAVSILYLFSSISMLIGPILCSLLLLQPGVTLRNIYQIHVVASIIIEVFVVTQIKETKSQSNSNEKVEYRSQILEILRGSAFRGIFVMTFLYHFFFSIMGTYTPIYARLNLGLSDADIASLSTYRSLGNMAVRFLLTTLLAKASVESLLWSGLLLGGISGTATIFCADYLSLSAITFVCGVSFGAKMITAHTVVTRNSTSKNRGVANGLYSIFQSSGNVTKLLTSPIEEASGLVPVFLLGGVAAFASIVPVIMRRVGR